MKKNKAKQAAMKATFRARKLEEIEGRAIARMIAAKPGIEIGPSPTRTGVAIKSWVGSSAEKECLECTEDIFEVFRRSLHIWTGPDAIRREKIAEAFAACGYDAWILLRGAEASTVIAPMPFSGSIPCTKEQATAAIRSAYSGRTLSGDVAVIGIDWHPNRGWCLHDALDHINPSAADIIDD